MATPVDNAVALTGNPQIDGLLQGSAWQFASPFVSDRILTYSLSQNDTQNGSWSLALTFAVRQAFTEWSNVAKVTFVEFGDGTVFTQSAADIAVVPTGNELQQALGAVGLGVFPSPSFADILSSEVGYTRASYPHPEGDVFLDSSYIAYNFVNAGGLGFEFILHEIGHALGLKHPFDSGNNGRPTFGQLGIADSDTTKFTVMSDTAPDGSSLDAGNPSTPMPLDILAIQRIYGANTSFHTGTDVYQLTGPLRTIWDAGGVDTLDASSSGAAAIIDLREGNYSVSGATTIAIAYNVSIENAIGSSFDDVIIGNAQNNTLIGGGGNDFIDGGPGADTMQGGPGNDTYIVLDAAPPTPSTLLSAHGDAGDFITFGQAYLYGPNDGAFNVSAADNDHDGQVDTVNVSFLGNTPGTFSNLDFSTRQIGQNLVAGNTYNNAVRYPFETSGHPGLSFTLNGRGANTLIGSFTVIDAHFDTSGPTPVIVSFSVNFEQHAEGASPAAFGTFNFNFGGGANSGDGPQTVVELPGEGTDSVMSSIAYTLPDNVENLTLTGSGNLTGTGNSLDNVIVGNSGNNVLAGDAGGDTLNGGIGADTLDGGAGVDTASYAGSAGVVVDLLGGVAWDGSNLDALTGIENATGSSSADQLWGDAGANVLSGGAGNDLLVGSLGADTLDGSAGVDTASYGGMPSGAVVDLLGGVAWDGSNLDTLFGIENASGSASADQLWGNAGANVLSGGGGDDLLVGWLGADTLDGGAGVDTASYAGMSFGVVVDLAGGVAWDGGDLDTVVGIENAIGSASGDQLWGGAGSNVLSGGAGNDLLVGWLGADTLDGGAGTDTASYAQHLGVVVDLLGGVAWDGGNLDTLTGIENAVGSPSADSMWGNAGANVLQGVGGDDLLVGGLGADTLDGGAGVDTVSYAGNAKVVVDLLGGVAWDGGDLDTLVGIENASGSAATDQLWGDAGANVLSGGDGDDLLVGWLGADTLDGGAGTDTVSYLQHRGVVVDLSGGVAWDGGSLDTLVGIENATGSTGADQLWGNAGSNVLDGGRGADYLNGGAGIDTASYTNMTSGVVVDLLGGVAWDGGDLDTLVGIENATGSASADQLWGDAGSNVLDGGRGADYLNGGAGVDTASYANMISGVVVDLLGGVAWDGGNLDTLVGIENAIGSASADQLWGDAGGNVLSGGAGNDLLVGDAGADTFIFNTTLNSSTNVDTIRDFTGGSDKVLLDHAIFTALSAGSLSSGSFVAEAGAVAHDAGDFILYDTASGNLLYDPDGSGVQAATLFASLTGHPSLSSTDLSVT